MGSYNLISEVISGTFGLDPCPVFCPPFARSRWLLPFDVGFSSSVPFNVSHPPPTPPLFPIYNKHILFLVLSDINVFSRCPRQTQTQRLN